jgi:hypothetical protein
MRHFQCPSLRFADVFEDRTGTSATLGRGDADDELVIGYQTFDTGDIAVFKAYFHVANN